MIREVVGENSGDLSSRDGPHRNSQTRLFPRPFFQVSQGCLYSYALLWSMSSKFDGSLTLAL